MKKLALILFVLVSTVSFAQEGVNMTRSNTLAISEVPPTWPGCDGSINQKNNCFRQKLANHVVRGFKFPAGHKSGTRVVVDMIINTKGRPEIKAMEGGSKALQAEIKRKIMSIPEVKPGHTGGTPEIREYKLPFTF